MWISLKSEYEQYTFKGEEKKEYIIKEMISDLFLQVKHLNISDYCTIILKGWI